MTRRDSTAVVLLVALTTLAPAKASEPAGAQKSAASPGWKVGYAEADITPKDGTAVMPAGFGNPRVVEGVESPLRAQAVAIEDQSGRRAVLFTADVLGFGRTTVDSVRYRLRERHKLPAESICFSASHTHWGPAINDRTGGAIGDVNVWYLRFLEEKLSTLADQALASLAGAEIQFGSCTARIGMCRRLLDKEGRVHWAVDPKGSYDRHTPILRIVRQQSPRNVVLVGHACHPTSMGAMNQWSPDYPGAMRRKLEAELEDSRAMFVQGCGGDAKVVHRNPKTGAFEFSASPGQSHNAGNTLAEAVLACIRGAGRNRDIDPKAATDAKGAPAPTFVALRPKLKAALVSGSLSLQPGKSADELNRMALGGSLSSGQTWWARKMRAFPDDRKAMRYDVQALQLGDLTLIALEGEVCADWGPFVRGLAATPHAMTVGYANEVSCYIPTARIVKEGGYEGEMAHRVYLLPAPFQPRVEVELTNLVERTIARLSDRGPPITPGPINREDLLEIPAENGRQQRITTAEQWEPRRRSIVAAVEQVTGPVPGPAFRVPLDLKVIGEEDCGKYVRKTIAYNVDPSDRVESFLLIPKGIKHPVPAILALHETNNFGKRSVAGLAEKTPKAMRRAYGHELAERGYVVIAPDYWYYGLYRGKYRVVKGEWYDPHQQGYATATMKGVWNHMRAIDVLETVKEADATRIGAIGHSLGGYNTLFLGLFDPRVKVMVSSAGYNSFVDYAASPYGGGDLSNWGIDKHMRRITTVYGNDPRKVPFDFPELLAALAPRPVFTSAPLRDNYFAHAGVLKCLKAAQPVYKLMGCEDHLQSQFPAAEHDFPDEARRAAYEFLDRHLKP